MTARIRKLFFLIRQPAPASETPPRAALEAKVAQATAFIVTASELRRLCQAVIDAYGDDDQIPAFNAAVNALRAAAGVGGAPEEKK